MRRRVLHKISPSRDYLLNFNSSNQDYIGRTDGSIYYYTFSGEFYVEIDFEYSALMSSYAAVMGRVTGSAGSFRILVNATTTLVSCVSNTNMTISKSHSTNTRYNIKVRRDASNVVWVSYSGGSETNIGTRSGNVNIDSIAYSDGTPRYLTGKIYRFNINGEEFRLKEGSGNTVTGSLGTILPINTSNVGGITYINNTMWEEII